MPAPAFTAKAIAVIKKIERLDPSRDDIGQLVAKVQAEAEPAEPLPLIPVHFESDTVSMEPFTDDPGRPIATSAVDANWQQRLDDERGDFTRSPLLADLPSEALRSLIGDLNLLIKNPGAVICGQGEAASSVFILASGFARAYRRGENQRYRQVVVLEEGHFFGEEALLEQDPKRPVTVTAASECELLDIDLFTLRELLNTRPAISEKLRKAHRRRPWNLHR